MLVFSLVQMMCLMYLAIISAATQSFRGGVIGGGTTNRRQQWRASRAGVGKGAHGPRDRDADTRPSRCRDAIGAGAVGPTTRLYTGPGSSNRSKAIGTAVRADGIGTALSTTLGSTALSGVRSTRSAR